MRFTKIFITIALSLQLFSCNANTFSIEIRHFMGAAGLTIYYTVTDKSITVDTDCDFENCTRKNVYTRIFAASQSDSLLTIFKSLRLDTLKASYQPVNTVFDGLVSSVKLRGNELPYKNITIDNVNVPVLDSLQKIIDGLIVSKKYRFNHFGEE